MNSRWAIVFEPINWHECKWVTDSLGLDPKIIWIPTRLKVPVNNPNRTCGPGLGNTNRLQPKPRRNKSGIVAEWYLFRENRNLFPRSFPPHFAPLSPPKNPSSGKGDPNAIHPISTERRPGISLPFSICFSFSLSQNLQNPQISHLSSSLSIKKTLEFQISNPKNPQRISPLYQY